MPAKSQAVRAVVVDMCVGIFLFAAMSLLAWHAAEQLARWDLIPVGAFPTFSIRS
jgi:hypothetical protein